MSAHLDSAVLSQVLDHGVPPRQVLAAQLEAVFQGWLER